MSETVLALWQASDATITALPAPQGEAVRPAYVARTAGRVALCLHGKLGDWHHSSTDHALMADRPKCLHCGHNASTASFARLLHAAMVKKVLEPNRRAGLVLDVFLHSWNPEVSVSSAKSQAQALLLHMTTT